MLDKAKLLVKLSVPQAFREAKKEKLMAQVSSGLVGQFQANLGLFRNRSQVPGAALAKGSEPGLRRALTTGATGGGGRRDSTNSADGMRKLATKRGVQRKQTLLVKDATIAAKDTEVDWRDRLK